MHAYDVILKSLVSEKSTSVREKENKYTFLVKSKATKKDIAQAVEAMWSVKPLKIATVLRRGKIKRRGRNLSAAKLTKRAIITLPKEAKLPLFEDL